jgi:myosin heavy subunit
MVPIPRRDRLPVTAQGQARCAGFHAAIANRIASMRLPTSPVDSLLSHDSERMAYEASAVFDTGRAIGGCDGYAPTEPVSTPNVVDLRSAASAIQRALPALKPAAKRLAQAEAEFAEIEKRHRELEELVAKKAEALRQVQSTYDEWKRKVEENKAEAARRAAELEVLNRAKARADMRKRFDEKLEELGQHRQRVAVMEQRLREIEQQRDAAIKDAEERKAAAETDRKLYEAGLRILDERKREVDELERQCRETEEIFRRAGAEPSRFVQSTPKPVGR